MAASTAKPPEAKAFWRFSLAFYALPEVSAALLALQDRVGHDVNLILFALWLGLSGRGRLDAGKLAAAEAAVAMIRTEIVEPLRRVRRRLKPNCEPDIRELRRCVEALELAAEKAAQYRLAAIAGAAVAEIAVAARLAAAEANLARYLGSGSAGSAEAALLRRSLAAFARAQ